jgi:hypothetical protein
MGAFHIVASYIHKACSKRLIMEKTEITIFIIGFFIFASYLFFLLRMISRQHKIQKNEDSSDLNAETKFNSES